MDITDRALESCNAKLKTHTDRYDGTLSTSHREKLVRQIEVEEYKIKVLEKQKSMKVGYTPAYQSYMSAGDESESYCLSCGSKVDEDDHFCRDCGQALDFDMSDYSIENATKKFNQYIKAKLESKSKFPVNTFKEDIETYVELAVINCSTCKNNIEFPPPHTCDECNSLDQLTNYCMWEHK